MKREIADRKNAFSLATWGALTRMVVRARFEELEFVGRETIPASGPFVLVCNHISRWDGLVVFELVGRPANYLVSPDELRGLQGAVLRSLGAFPADGRLNPVGFARSRLERGEGVVIFPEGNVFYDGATHPFKNGAARTAITAALAGTNPLLIPVAVSYGGNGKSSARCLVGEPVDLGPYVQEYLEQSNMGIRSLTVRLEREVCFLRRSLGAKGDEQKLFEGQPVKAWVPRGQSGAASKTVGFRPGVLDHRAPWPVADGSPDRDRAKVHA